MKVILSGLYYALVTDVSCISSAKKNKVMSSSRSYRLGILIWPIKKQNFSECLLKVVVNFCFIVSCYSLKTGKCCECFYDVDPSRGEGIYCTK